MPSSCQRKRAVELDANLSNLGQQAGRIQFKGEPARRPHRSHRVRAGRPDPDLVEIEEACLHPVDSIPCSKTTEGARGLEIRTSLIRKSSSLLPEISPLLDILTVQKNVKNPIKPTAGVLLLTLLVAGCSRSARHPVAAVAAAAAAREHALQQERANAAAEDQDRQDLDSIPLPSRNVYTAIHTRQSWVNPFLIVTKSTVSLSILYPDNGPANSPGSEFLRPVAARRRLLELRLSDLPRALAATPPNVWPYGRVIAVEEDPTASRDDRAQIRRNVESTMQVLNDLGVVVYEWPPNGPR